MLLTFSERGGSEGEGAGEGGAGAGAEAEGEAGEGEGAGEGGEGEAGAKGGPGTCISFSENKIDILNQRVIIHLFLVMWEILREK